MKQNGFKTRIIQNKEILKSMNTLKKFKLKNEEVLRQSGNFEVYIMTLSK